MGKFNQNNNNVSNITSNDDWKADGFINAALPWSDGSNKKIGAFNLKLSVVHHKLLIEMLEKDPDATLAMIKANLVLDYKPAVAAVVPGAGFKFG